MLVVGPAGCRGDDQPDNTPDYKCVLGILHQKFEKDDGCPPSRQTYNHQDVCFHFASSTVRNFFLEKEIAVKLIVDMIR